MNFLITHEKDKLGPLGPIHIDVINAKLLSKQCSGANLQVVLCQGIWGDMTGAAPIVQFVRDEIGPGRMGKISCPANGIIVRCGKIAINGPC